MSKPKTQSPEVWETPGDQMEHLGGTVGDHSKTASLDAGLRAFLQPPRARVTRRKSLRVRPRRRAGATGHKRLPLLRRKAAARPKRRAAGKAKARPKAKAMRKARATPAKAPRKAKRRR